ncbi:MAG: hypothetical protein ISS34_01655 [Candidatus Omnitrophica bacterium]|nr:hypothetical protein [Candidatus Omnitrophota bacterium]
MRNLSKRGFFISNKIGKAVADYRLIEDKDKIIVAVSGGKDSLTMLKMLLERRRWAPVSYDILAVHVITDYHCAGCAARSYLEKFFEDNNCPYRFIEIRLKAQTKIPAAARAAKGKQLKRDAGDISCFWCSWNRRKALFKLASEIGYNKIALGHHKDDVIETILLNLFYNGEISAINARQPLFNGKVTIIRPLVYIEEREIRAYARESGLPKQACRCPNNALSKRALMKRVISDLEKGSSQIKSNIFNAPTRIKSDYLCAKEM